MKWFVVLILLLAVNAQADTEILLADKPVGRIEEGASGTARLAYAGCQIGSALWKYVKEKQEEGWIWYKMTVKGELPDSLPCFELDGERVCACDLIFPEPCWLPMGCGYVSYAKGWRGNKDDIRTEGRCIGLMALNETKGGAL